jgi:hypothetical protein
LLSTDVVEVIGVHGGVKFYNGAGPRALRRARPMRADDYTSPGHGRGAAGRDAVSAAGLDGDAYEQWFYAHVDVDISVKSVGSARTRTRCGSSVIVNGPNLVAGSALHPEVSGRSTRPMTAQRPDRHVDRG